MSKVAALVLAAGGSTRLGRPKQLLTLDGESLLRRAVRAVVASAAAPVVVVLGADAEESARQIADLPVETVRHERWREGLAGSLRAGLSAVQRATPDAVLIALCDQPFLNAPLLELLITTYHAAPGGIVACAYAGTHGVPAIFAARHFPALEALRGEAGARRLLVQFAHEVITVPFPRGEIDIDTPAAYAALLATWAPPMEGASQAAPRPKAGGS